MSPMDQALNTLYMAALPALASAAFLMTALTLLGGAKQAPGGAALGLAAAALLGCWLNTLLPLVPGESAWNRLPWAALGALAVGRLVRLPELPWADGLLLRMATAIGIAWWLISEDQRAEIAWLAPAFAAVVAAEWLLLDYLAADPRGGTVPWILALAFFAAGVVFIHAGTKKFMDVSIVLSAALVGIALVAWWGQVDAGGVNSIVAVLLPGLLLVAQRNQETEIPWHAFALTACAPLMLFFSLPMRRWEGVGPRLVQIMLVLIPLGIALYLALEKGTIEFDPPDE